MSIYDIELIDDLRSQLDNIKRGVELRRYALRGLDDRLRRLLDRLSRDRNDELVQSVVAMRDEIAAVSNCCQIEIVESEQRLKQIQADSTEVVFKHYTNGKFEVWHKPPLRLQFMAELRELCQRYQIQIDDYIDIKHDTGEQVRVVEFVHRPSNAEDWWCIEIDEKLLD